MATITLRLDDWARDELDRLAQARGTTVSDLLRSLIDQLLGKDVELPGGDAPRSLDLVQRRGLALQHEILAMLHSRGNNADDSEEEKYHRARIEVLENGFTAEYGEEFLPLGPELAPGECELTWDILDMFSVLESSVAKLSAEDLAGLGDGAARTLSFRGFDANDQREARLLGYSRYLIKNDKWTNLADHFSAAQERGNSHMPVLATYRRMLGAYKPIWEGKLRRGTSRDAYAFDSAELRAVLDAWPYPGNTN